APPSEVTVPLPPRPADAAVLLREQREVGVLCARRAGGVLTAASALHLLALTPAQLLTVVPSAALLVVSALVQLAPSRSVATGARAVALGLALDVAALVAFLSPDVDASLRAILSGITMLTSMALPCAMLAVGAWRGLPWAAVLALLPVLVLGAATTGASGRAPFVLLSIVVCWALLLTAARWLAGSVARAHVGTARLRRAHDAERRSSETESRHRADARLMHDTILATLTLVAHRGEGVPAPVLRDRAAADLALLRGVEAVDEPEPASGVRLPEPLAALGRRSAEVGVEVRWHGGAQPRIRAEVLDALVRATGECLENVRRHSGAALAHVSVAEEAGSLRVVVTDEGRGFDPAAVPPGRLGLAESVVGRVEAVGGTVRVFSAPGSGATVLLSVPLLSVPL
ncbi:sensor histidine kinase, partial [Rathayibacter sp. AY1F4]